MRNGLIATLGLAAVAVAGLLVESTSPAGAQILPTSSTTSTTTPDPTTSTTTEETTTSSTDTTADDTTTTSTATTAPEETTSSTAAPRTTTSTGTTAPPFVPPAGVTSTIVPPTEEEVLEAKTGRLPVFVSLSLLGFTIAIAIVTVQWVKTRPRAGRPTIDR